MNKLFISWCAVCLLSVAGYGCAATPALQRSAEAPTRVLFVGNSFTYYNDSLHNHLLRLVRADDSSDGNAYRMRTMTVSGARLSEHSAGFAAMVQSEDWDVVVLQGHSRGPVDIETRADFLSTARRFDRVIRASGASTAFYMTWAYEGRPEMTSVLDAQYSGIGNELNALVVPVGLAFEWVTNEHPEIGLRNADARHPSLAGTYLAACVFYAALFNKTPVGNKYTAGLDAGTVEQLQKASWSVTRAYQNSRASGNN